MPDPRLDSALVQRGLARSRAYATTLISDGLVTVEGKTVRKPATRVGPDRSIVVTSKDHYVSRAAHKLIAAVDEFDIPIRGRTALDAGASTGGFSQVLLERGVAEVIAVDVGHGQLSRELAAEPRLVSVEGVNVRYMTAASLAEASGVSTQPDLVVGDLSFISLRTVLPALAATATASADLVLLVKPQFEVGRTGVRDGIVREPRLRHEAVSGVLHAAWELGLKTAGLIPSPITGGAGNREYLTWLSATSGGNPTEWINGLSVMDGV